MKKRIKFICIGIIIPVVIEVFVFLLLNSVDNTRRKIFSYQNQIITTQQSILYDLGKLSAYVDTGSKHKIKSAENQFGKDEVKLKEIDEKYDRYAEDKLVNQTSRAIKSKLEEIDRNNQLIQQKYKSIVIYKLK